MNRYAPISRGLFVALLGVAAGAAELRGDLRAHDPSTMISAAGRNWLFYTGPGCKTKSSADLIAWRAGAPVFPKPLAWWSVVAPGTKQDVWAPDIVQVGARYYL
jgi:arabinan endo-1,5-alpha-L-arabinosidase